MPDESDTPIKGYAIVLLGSFNPPIFQPGWFARHGLIEEDKADAARNVHVDGESSVFETTEFGCEVTRDRVRLFTVPTTERREQLGDTAADVFALLYHTPIGGISLITFRHVPPATRRWDELAARLAHNDAWDDIVAGDARLDRLVIRRDIDGELEGVLGLAAEASRLIEGGVYLSVTHQYRLKAEDAETAEVARDLLRSRWGDAVGESDDVIDRAVALS